MLSNEIHQPIDRFCLRNVEFHGFLADVKIDLSGCPSDIAEIGICHFARPVDDATHDRDLYPFQVIGGGPDPRRGLLQVKQGPTARWTRHIIRLEDSGSGCLQNIVAQAKRLPGRDFALDQDRVSDPVTQ